jgi:hypothetical protein
MKLYELFSSLKKGDVIESCHGLRLFFDGEFFHFADKKIGDFASLSQGHWMYVEWHVVKPQLKMEDLKPGKILRRKVNKEKYIVVDCGGGQLCALWLDHLPWPNLVDLKDWEVAE